MRNAMTVAKAVVDQRWARSARMAASLRSCSSADRTPADQRFRLRRVEGGLREIRVRWSAHFPNAGVGTYRVRFSQGPPTVNGQTLGPR